MSTRRSASLAGGLAYLAATPALADNLLDIEAGQTTLSADGQSFTTLAVQATGPDGLPLPNGTVVPLSTTLGRLSGDGVVSGGRATFQLQAGTFPGVAALGALGFQVAGDAEIALVADAGVSTTLHLHGSFSEGNGTMRGHSIEAEGQGIDVLWWTDHDYLYYPGHEMEVAGFDFEQGLSYDLPTWPAGETTTISWSRKTNTFSNVSDSVTTAAARSGSYGWRLSGTASPNAQWRSLLEGLGAWPIPLNIKPLMSEVAFSAWVRPQVAASANTELWFTFVLSRGTDGYDRKIHLYQSNSSYASLNSTRERYIRFNAPRGVWTQVSADLTSIARANFPDFGDDSSVTLVNVQLKARNGATATYDLDDFSWSQELVGDELRDVQRAYLASLPYEPEQLAGMEIGISEGRHFNAFGSSVPMLSYGDRADWSYGDIVDFVHAYGGLVSSNHMFGVRLTCLSEMERAAEVADAIDDLVAEDAYGADLLEVGYREREGLLADFLEVWDALSMEGIVITGIGANDAHDQVDWDSFTNNFTTWAGSPGTAESDLLWNLGRGMVWFGDPTLFVDGAADAQLLSTTSRAVMGQVVVGETAAQDITFRAGTLQAGWTVRMVENGAVTETWAVGSTGTFAADTVIDPTGGNVVRFEVVTDQGEPAIYTNPIYFFDAAVPAQFGEERLPAP